MAIRPDYDIGTVTLTSGSSDFTTSGSSLQTAAIQAGDSIIAPSGHVLIIATITGQNSGTLFLPCPAAAAGTGLALRIRFQPDGSRYQGAVRNLIDLLSSGNLEALASLVGAAGMVPIFTGPGTLDLADPTTFGIPDPNGSLEQFAALARANNKFLAVNGSGSFEYRSVFGGTRNVLFNPLMNINQRAVSGTVTLAAGAYGHDRFKAGASGCTYTFSSNNGVVTLNITAGSLLQVIEASSFAGRAGTYFLSWSGTAQGRIGAGAYGASGAVSAAINGSSDVSVEFNTGTLSLPQLERGYVTDFSTTNMAQELANCQRYFEVGEVEMRMEGIALGAYYIRQPFLMQKRTVPTLTATSQTATNLVSQTVNVQSIYGLLHSVQCNTAGAFRSKLTYTADADI